MCYYTTIYSHIVFCMNTRLLPVTSLLLGAILLIGAGCANTNSPSDTVDLPPLTKSATDVLDPNSIGTNSTDDVVPEEMPPEDMSDAEIRLVGEAAGKNMVKLEWDVDEDTDVSDGFILVRSDKPNPSHDQVNYWWRQHEKSREGTWIKVPSGVQHFRVCILRDAECAAYSNDVEVTVQ